MNLVLEKIVHYPQIGIVKYVRSKRARRISISVRALKNITVTVPFGISYNDAEHFVHEKLDWILKTKKKVEEVERKQTVFTNESAFQTKFRKLKLIADKRTNLRVNVTKEFVEIYYPQQLPVVDKGLQNAIKRAIEHAWHVEGYEYLPDRLSYLAHGYSFNYKGLKVKNTKSFWGSCALDNIITLSLHLMHLPDELIDYVILHELCHTVHKNHSKDFWNLLDKVTNGKAKILAKKMRDYSTRVY